MTDQGPEPSTPDGTVYGRGGVHARSPRGGESGGLHPIAIILAFGAGVVVLLALAYYALRIPPDAPVFTAPPTTQLAPSPTETPSPTEQTPSPAPDRFGIGSWLLSPADDPNTHLSVQGDFAAMSSVDPIVLTVVTGAADAACFTFRDQSGKYLRHFDFRLRFDVGENTDLFRADATFCAEGGQVGDTVRLTSKNYPDRLLHRRGAELYIDPSDNSDKFAKESTFAVHKPPNS